MDGGFTKAVENLVSLGETDTAISLLESTISDLGNCVTSFQSDMRKLSSALFLLAKVYSIKGLSVEANQIKSRAIRIQQCSEFDLKEFQVLGNKASSYEESTDKDGRRAGAKSLTSLYDEFPSGGGSYDDWKAAAERAPPEYSTLDTTPRSLMPRGRGPTYRKQDLRSDLQSGVPAIGELEAEDEDTEIRDYWGIAADRASTELYSTLDRSDVSNISLKDAKPQSPKRLGRGPFTYRRQSDGPASGELEDEVMTHSSQKTGKRDLIYGTSHVLVLADFPSGTKKKDLEKLLEAFRGRFKIHSLNNKTTLAVFETPHIAREAYNSVQCQFTKYILDENDGLLSSIRPHVLEPPRPRPRTDITVARRLIANSLGLRLPFSSSGSKEVKEQEKKGEGKK